MKKLAIFDLDGTLLNTIADLGHSVNHALREHGYQEHSIASYHMMVGNGVRKLIERAAPDVDEQQLETLLASFMEYYLEHCTDNTRPYEGIPELLEKLHHNEVAIAVCSNKFQAATEKIITTFFPSIPFVSILGQSDDRPRKPDPSIVFATLLKHPTPKAEVIYVGDSAVDIETARRACVESVGVTWGFRPVSELRRACADHLISHPSELMKYIGQE